MKELNIQNVKIDRRDATSLARNLEGCKSLEKMNICNAEIPNSELMKILHNFKRWNRSVIVFISYGQMSTISKRAKEEFTNLVI